MSKRMIVIDTETTGLNPCEDEILQLSIIDENAETLYNQYFKPQKTDSWRDAQAVNGISSEMVRNCPPIQQKIKEIQKIIDTADIIVGYNVNFDMSFLEVAGIFSDAQMVDVMKDFAEIYGEWSDYYGSYKWQKLSVCASYYGYDWGNDTAHDSLADCRATLYCHEKMWEEKERKGQEEKVYN